MWLLVRLFYASGQLHFSLRVDGIVSIDVYNASSIKCYEHLSKRLTTFSVLAMNITLLVKLSVKVTTECKLDSELLHMHLRHEIWLTLEFGFFMCYNCRFPKSRALLCFCH